MRFLSSLDYEDPLIILYTGIMFAIRLFILYEVNNRPSNQQITLAKIVL
jgi:hypothetical protein